MAMEAAIDMLQKGGVEEFMQISSTALKVIQNVLTYPMEDKYRRIRTTCKVGFCGSMHARAHANLQRIC